MNDATPRLTSPRRAQTAVPLLVLLAIAATCLGLGAAAHSRSLESWLVGRDLASFRAGAEHMAMRDNRLDFEDRWILDELPGADRSHGGVYFFGSSPMKWGLAPWEIPADVRPYVGNYAIGATDHAMQFQLIRFLVEKEDLLRAGPDKVHLVLGLYWSMGQLWKPQGFFGPLWQRHGLYRYDPVAGISEAVHQPWLAAVKRERARCSSFIGGNLHRLARLAAITAGVAVTETDDIQDPRAIREWADRLAVRDDWQTPLDAQMDALAQLFDYLDRHQATATIVLLPHRAPFEDLPMPVAYRERLRTFCDGRGVPFVDLSRLLAENEFWDMNHSNYAGLMKTHAALMEIAEQRLRAMGVVP